MSANKRLYNDRGTKIEYNNEQSWSVYLFDTQGPHFVGNRHFVQVIAWLERSIDPNDGKILLRRSFATRKPETELLPSIFINYPDMIKAYSQSVFFLA